MTANAPNSILIVRIGFIGADGTPVLTDCDHGCLTGWMWNDPASVSKQFADSSQGFTFAPPPVSRVVTVQTTIPAASATCAFDVWTNVALAQMQQELGFNHTAYTFRLFLLPLEAGGTACNWGGLGVLGCQQRSCNAWARKLEPARVWVHELGHLTGLHHASLDLDDDGVVDVNGERAVGTAVCVCSPSCNEEGGGGREGGGWSRG
jgi:hypothetical protein